VSQYQLQNFQLTGEAWRYRGPRTREGDAVLRACAVNAFKGEGSAVRGADYVQYGCSPLIAAVMQGDTHGIRELLFRGADPRALSPCGLTAISIAGASWCVCVRVCV
jgi:hypothetical protein